MKSPQVLQKGNQLFISGELTIYRISEVQETIVACALGDAICSVDLGSVTEIDTSGLQLLLCLSSMGVALVKPSEAVSQMLNLVDTGMEIS